MHICPMSHCPLSHISLPSLAKRLGVSRRNLQRMAADGVIPGASRTIGGQWRVKKDAHLDGWISRMEMERALRQTVGRSKTAPLVSAIAECEKRLDALLWAGGGKVTPGLVAAIERLAENARCTAGALRSLATFNDETQALSLLEIPL